MKLAITALGTTLALLLSACGSSESSAEAPSETTNAPVSTTEPAPEPTPEPTIEPTEAPKEVTVSFTLTDEEGYTLDATVASEPASFTVDPSTSPPGKTQLSTPFTARLSLKNTTAQRELQLPDGTRFPKIGTVRAYPLSSPVCKSEVAMDQVRSDKLCFVEVGTISNEKVPDESSLLWSVDESKDFTQDDFLKGPGISVEPVEVAEDSAQSLINAINDYEFAGVIVQRDADYTAWTASGADIIDPTDGMARAWIIPSK
jgi:hypothetical protein